jgi:hypothetical protein
MKLSKFGPLTADWNFGPVPKAVPDKALVVWIPNVWTGITSFDGVGAWVGGLYALNGDHYCVSDGKRWGPWTPAEFWWTWAEEEKR